VESFNGKHRDELLGIEIFIILLEEKFMAEDYSQGYSQRRLPLITGIQNTTKI
jgi:hypothetical protein